MADDDSATSPGMSVSTRRPNSSSNARITTWIDGSMPTAASAAWMFATSWSSVSTSARAPGMPHLASASASAGSASTSGTPRRARIDRSRWSGAGSMTTTRSASRSSSSTIRNPRPWRPHTTTWPWLGTVATSRWLTPRMVPDALSG
jgi:hypothetical protein